MFPAKVRDMNEQQKATVRGLSQTDIPIQQRRALYNGLARRMAAGKLKPGLVEKYNAAAASRKDRFSLLKEFIIDEDMSAPQPSKNHDATAFSKCCILMTHYVYCEGKMWRWKHTSFSETLKNCKRNHHYDSMILSGWTLKYP